MTFYRIIFPLVLLSLMLMYLPSSDVYLLSFTFWWCTYSTFIWLLPPLFCVLLIFLSYSDFLLPPLHSGDIPTVPSSDFYLPSFAFCWCTYPILSSSFSLLHSGDSTLFWLIPTLFCILLMYLPLLLVSHSFSLIIWLKTNLLHSQPHLQVHFSTMITYLHPCPFLLTSHSCGHPLPFLPNIF